MTEIFEIEEIIDPRILPIETIGKLAALGRTEAIFMMAYTHYYGINEAEQNHQTSVAFAREGHKRGDVFCTAMFGRALWTGVGVAKDQRRGERLCFSALPLLTQAGFTAPKFSLYARNLLGCIYLLNVARQKTGLQLAMDALRSALPLPAAQYHYAVCLQKADRKKHESQIEELYCGAAEGGILQAQIYCNDRGLSFTDRNSAYDKRLQGRNLGLKINAVV